MTSRTSFLKEYGPLLFGHRLASQMKKTQRLDSMKDLYAWSAIFCLSESFIPPKKGGAPALAVQSLFQAGARAGG